MVVVLIVGGCSTAHTAASSSPPTPAGPTSTVPDITGEPVSQAVQTLQADGFEPGDTGLAPNEIVISTDPAAGTYSGGSAFIRLTASPPTTTTVPPQLVVVPNVKGRTITAAGDAMAAVGLTLDCGAVYPTNIVAYTVPAAGTKAPFGSDIEEYSCAAGGTPSQLASGSWTCNPGNYGPDWGGQ
jgi:beta-lactam-binding protein with PASTA domain